MRDWRVREAEGGGLRARLIRKTQAPRNRSATGLNFFRGRTADFSIPFLPLYIMCLCELAQSSRRPGLPVIESQSYDYGQANAQHRQCAYQRGEPKHFAHFVAEPFPKFHGLPPAVARWLLNLREAVSFPNRAWSLSLWVRLLTLQLIEQFAELLRHGLGNDLVENASELPANVLVQGKVSARGRGRRAVLLSVGLSFCHGHLHHARTSYILRNGTQRSRTLLERLGRRAMFAGRE
jgi:hypothetical protein